VVASLTNNNLGSYWTSAGPYDEIYYYINHNVAAVRDELAQMTAGIPVLAKVREYAASSMNLVTKDEIFSAMVVYGFLTYENGCVSIPNKELMDKFSDMLLKEPSLGYVHQLTVLVTLLYLSAGDSYRVEREDKAGIGFVDFIFYPEVDRSADAVIVELKVDHTAEEAVQQIKDRKYALKFEGKIGEALKYTGRVLGVGIAYDRRTKQHTCRIEVLREQRSQFRKL
jgi:ribosomal protein L21E